LVRSRNSSTCAAASSAQPLHLLTAGLLVDGPLRSLAPLAADLLSPLRQGGVEEWFDRIAGELRQQAGPRSRSSWPTNEMTRVSTP
jgi:hypothetical protein